MLAVSILMKYNTNIKQTAWGANWGCELVSNPSYNESGEIIVSFVMYTVSSSDKQGAKGAPDSAMYESDSTTSMSAIMQWEMTIAMTRVKFQLNNEVSRVRDEVQSLKTRSEVATRF
jgi:hypothetical protein